MKSRRNSRAPMMDIPEHVTVEILLRLSIKEIVMCKCTCKAWRYLISSNHFVELHHVRAEACLLVRSLCHYPISRTLNLIEASKMNVNCCCNLKVAAASTQLFSIKLDTKLKIPLCRGREKMSLNSNITGIIDEASAHSDGIAKRKPTIELDPLIYNPFHILNSCNGLLCLTTVYSKLTIVCNPITDEFIEVPSDSSFGFPLTTVGLGFCLKTKQYKVLRVSARNDMWNIRVAEIHTLGTNSWRRIGSRRALPFNVPEVSPIYLNGVLYWIIFNSSRKPYILSFEFHVECFRLLPKLPIERCPGGKSMGIIGDRLCFCADFVGLTDIWVVKNCGDKKSWSKLISISNSIKLNTRSVKLSISCSNCKAFVFLQCFGNDKIMFYDSKREEWRKCRVHRNQFYMAATVHTPSLILLKDALPGANVISISTCFKLPGEFRPPYLREET